MTCVWRRECAGACSYAPIACSRARTRTHTHRSAAFALFSLAPMYLVHPASICRCPAPSPHPSSLSPMCGHVHRLGRRPRVPRSSLEAVRRRRRKRRRGQEGPSKRRQHARQHVRQPRRRVGRPRQHARQQRRLGRPVLGRLQRLRQVPHCQRSLVAATPRMLPAVRARGGGHCAGGTVLFTLLSAVLHLDIMRWCVLDC